MSWERCPHCALPGLFPNVRAAEASAEREALGRRYEGALRTAADCGTGEKIAQFEEAVAGSKAVLARSMRELDRLSSSDQELFTTYYGLLRGEVWLPHDNKWDRLRRIADEALFLGYREHIRFAALALDGAGLAHYGECSFVFRDTMIRHRASVYEENSALSLKKHGYEPPLGHRATWLQRSTLCVAKVAGDIHADTPRDQFPRLVLSSGAAPEEDRFVEVHIWGPMTIRTVERILVAKVRSQAVLMSLEERARGSAVELEDIQ